MDDASSFSIRITQLVSTTQDMVRRVFDSDDENFVENRSKPRNDPLFMKNLELEKAKSNKDASSHPSLQKL